MNREEMVREENSLRMTKREFIEELVDEVAKDWESIDFLDDDELYRRFYKPKNRLTFMVGGSGRLTGFAIQLNYYPKIYILYEPGETSASIVFRDSCGEIRRPLDGWISSWFCDRVLGRWGMVKESFRDN